MSLFEKVYKTLSWNFHFNYTRKILTT